MDIQEILEFGKKLQPVDLTDEYYAELCNRLRPKMLEKFPNAKYGLINECSDWIGTGQDILEDLSDELGLMGYYKSGQRGWQYFEL